MRSNLPRGTFSCNQNLICVRKEVTLSSIGHVALSQVVQLHVHLGPLD